MTSHVVLLRGVNVGGKNIISMAALRKGLEGLGFSNVASYIASGNLILDSKLSAAKTQAAVEGLLADAHGVARDSARALVLTQRELEAVISKRPHGFGSSPDKYNYDVVFLMSLTPSAAMRVFSPREGVDKIWPGPGVIYSQRLSAERTKSRLNRIMGTPEYRSMTIRTWNTTVKLLELVTNPRPVRLGSC